MRKKDKHLCAVWENFLFPQTKAPEFLWGAGLFFTNTIFLVFLQAFISLNGYFGNAVSQELLAQASLRFSQQIWIFQTDMKHGIFFQTIRRPDIELGDGSHVFQHCYFPIKLAEIHIAGHMV